MRAIWCLKFWNMAKSGGTICISVRHSKFWGIRPPVPFPIVIYAHALHVVPFVRGSGWSPPTLWACTRPRPWTAPPSWRAWMRSAASWCGPASSSQVGRVSTTGRHGEPARAGLAMTGRRDWRRAAADRRSRAGLRDRCVPSATSDWAATTTDHGRTTDDNDDVM